MDFATGLVAMLGLLLSGFLVGIILLQIFLARRESRWPGLVLPAITLLYSLVMACNVMAGADAWRALLATLALGNIPTVVLLAIYAACREKRRKNSEMDKMDIHDL